MILACEQVIIDDIAFSLTVQMEQAKMNLYFSLPIYSLIST